MRLQAYRSVMLTPNSGASNRLVDAMAYAPSTNPAAFQDHPAGASSRIRTAFAFLVSNASPQADSAVATPLLARSDEELAALGVSRAGLLKQSFLSGRSGFW